MSTRAYYQEMGERLRSVRRARKLTQRQFSEQCGIPVYTIYRIEKYGAVYLRAELFATVATSLGVTVEHVTANDWRLQCGVEEEVSSGLPT